MCTLTSLFVLDTDALAKWSDKSKRVGGRGVHKNTLGPHQQQDRSRSKASAGRQISRGSCSVRKHCNKLSFCFQGRSVIMRGPHSRSSLTRGTSREIVNCRTSTERGLVFLEEETCEGNDQKDSLAPRVIPAGSRQQEFAYCLLRSHSSKRVTDDTVGLRLQT